jgi:Zn-dependent peptidase ImmA (M78 family)/transcriptional regulator with XRE-family HTH domain
MINGERVTLVRELKRWTQSDLAKRVGKTQSAVAQLEAGLFAGSDDLIREIAVQADFPEEFFRTMAPPRFPQGSLMFRAHRDLSKKDRAEAHRHAQLAFEVAVHLYSRLTAIPVIVPSLAGDTPEHAARITRGALSVGTVEPVHHVVSVLERSGVLVVIIPDLPKRDAFTVWAGDNAERPVVALCANRPPDRLRMNVAHELGHLVLHRTQSITSAENEKEAAAFAAEFLMPKAAIQRDLKPPITLTLLAKLKRKWKVSMQSLVVRARDVGVLTERQYRYLFEQLSINQWRSEEPPMGIPAERPRLIRQMVETLYGNPINYSKLSCDVSLSPKYLQPLLEQFQRKREPSEAELMKKIVPLRRKQ